MEAIAWKQAPYNLTSKRFTDVPARLRSALSKLLDAPTDKVVLANSASYGLHFRQRRVLPTLRHDLGARAYDIFGTANFFNFMPWTALEYLLDKGIDNIANHDAALVERLIEGLEARSYRVSSPTSGPERSTLVLASHEDRTRNESIHRALGEGDIEIAYRRGNLPFSPHLYNTTDDIDRALVALTKHRRNRSAW